MKQVMITEDEYGDNNALYSMIDFIKDNADAMPFDEINKIIKLKVNESCYVSTHCGYVTVTRIK